MKTTSSNPATPHLAQCVAPEDLNCGDYVAVLNVIYELPSYFWCCVGDSIEIDQPVQMKFREPNAGTPLKVKAICLPFVFVKAPDGTKKTLDVRRIQLVRLHNDYASLVWNEMKAPQKSSSSN